MRIHRFNCCDFRSSYGLQMKESGLMKAAGADEVVFEYEHGAAKAKK